MRLIDFNRHRIAKAVAVGATVAAVAAGAMWLNPYLDAELDSRRIIAEPDGYRLTDYSAPVPPGLSGATTVDAKAVRALIDEGHAVAIDTQPVPIDGQRQNIPDSWWLPDIGGGHLDDDEQAALKAVLDRATGGDPARPLVFYCRTDCWLSWNAAKRALAMGFQSVYWFPEGTDGWIDAGFPLATPPQPTWTPDMGYWE